MILGRRDLRAKASMQCLFGLVNEPYFILFSRISFNFKVLILGRTGLASHLEVGCRAVEHFRLPASPVNTLGIGSQLSNV